MSGTVLGFLASANLRRSLLRNLFPDLFPLPLHVVCEMPDAKEDEVATPTTPAPDSDKPAEPAADAPQPKPKRKRKWDDAGDAAAAAPADQNGAEEKKDEGEKKDDAERDGSGTPTTDAAKGGPRSELSLPLSSSLLQTLQPKRQPRSTSF